MNVVTSSSKINSINELVASLNNELSDNGIIREYNVNIYATTFTFGVLLTDCSDYQKIFATAQQDKI